MRKKEQVILMKFTQNVVAGAAARSRIYASHSEAATAVAAALWAAFLPLTSTAFAQNADNIAEREVQRRQAAIPAGEAALARGKSALHSRNYTVAYQEFKTAIAYLPDAVVSGRSHDEAADGVCKSGTVLAEARIAQGDYAGAEAILSEILNRYDPNCRKAQELLAHMRQPGYFNKTVDASFINKVEEVKRLLAEADGYYQSGQYDKAMKSYDRVLALDPYNTAARGGQEKIDNTKYQYGEEAYNETRARHLWKVEEAWQQPVMLLAPPLTTKGEEGKCAAPRR
jgi:general secretion pathway protein D